MERPGWACSTGARRWLVIAALLLVFLGGRLATRSFGAQTVLSDGAKAYASCKSPWRSARIDPPAQRFTLWVMSGGTGQRRDEGVATLGARCRSRARGRMVIATAFFGGAAALTWLALPRRPRPAKSPPTPPPSAPEPA